MMRYGYGMMFGFGIIPLLLIGLTIYGVVKLLQNSYENNNTKIRDNDAINILNQRYAKGEITEEEYEKIKRALRD